MSRSSVRLTSRAMGDEASEDAFYSFIKYVEHCYGGYVRVTAFPFGKGPACHEIECDALDEGESRELFGKGLRNTWSDWLGGERAPGDDFVRVQP